MLAMEPPGSATWSHDGSDIFWANGSSNQLVAVKSESLSTSNDLDSLLSYFKASPVSSSPVSSSFSIWSPNQQQSIGNASPPTSYSPSLNNESLNLKGWTTSSSPVSQHSDLDVLASPMDKGKSRSEDQEPTNRVLAITRRHEKLSYDAHSMQFLHGYSPFGGFPAPSSEQRHQISMLSSMDLFLKTRLLHDTSPLRIDYRNDGAPSLFEDAFNKFWSVFYLLEAGKMDEAFEALDAWCEYTKDLLKTQQPPLLGLLSMMMDEFRALGRPEIAEKVLNYLTGLADVYFGKRHPISVMLWCLRASNVADEHALPELAMERAVIQLGSLQHDHIALLREEFKLRWSHILRQRNKVDEAVVVLRELVDENEKVYGPGHVKTLEPLFSIGRCWFACEHYLPGAVAFQEVLQRVGDLECEDLCWIRACSHGRLAQTYKRLGYEKQAMTHALALLTEAGKIWHKDHPQRKVWLARLAKDNIL